jgi:hypothetical protein
MRASPRGGLYGIALRIHRLKSQIHAAIEFVASMKNTPELVFGGCDMDAGNEEPLADAFFKERSRSAETVPAAGQGNNPVSARNMRRSDWDFRYVNEESSNMGCEQRQQQNGQQ